VTAAQCLERERELQRAAEAFAGSREYVWVWECEARAVVMGRSGALDAQVKAAACEEDGVPVLRRDSGGGTVLLGPGCLAYTLILDMDRRPELRDVAGSYRSILGSVVAAAGLAMAERPENDLAVAGRKFGGCSQRRMRRTLLHHGTLLYDFAIGDVERYLAEPQRRPAYRGERGHAEFLRNAPVHPEFARRLHACFPEAERVS